MKWVKSTLKRLWHDDSGQGMVEYALIIALIAVLLVGGLTLLRGGIEGTFNDIIQSL